MASLYSRSFDGDVTLGHGQRRCLTQDYESYLASIDRELRAFFTARFQRFRQTKV